tara:strand:- start:487 stop:999 length:513 start_codon:yes stop_codon:yes gene_type:complete
MADVYSKVDVSVSPYMSQAAADDMPAVTTGIKSASFPDGYFGGGSLTATIDNDSDIGISKGGVVATSGDGSAATPVQISNTARQGTLIVKHSGYTSSAKTTASNAAAILRISCTNADNNSTAIVDLVAKNDTFVIPYTAQNISAYFVMNESQTASQPAYLEFVIIDNAGN